LYEWIGKLTGNDKALQRIAAVCGRIPAPFMIMLCRVLATVFYRLAGKKLREQIRTNMAELLGPMPERLLTKRCKAYFVNLTVSLYEILIDSYRLSALDRRTARRFSAVGEHYLDEVLKLGKGAIVYTPHVGNFFYSYWYLCQKYSCLAVVTAESPELRPIYLRFQALGCRGLDYDATPPLEMMRALRKHLASGGVLFLLGDFYRPTFPPAVLFGRRTRSPEGTASLALEQEVPVVPFYGYRWRGFRHRLVFAPPRFLHERYSRTERSEATNELNRFIEQAIRLVPSHWFYWFNAGERWEPSASDVQSVLEFVPLESDAAG
jgi:KDO2-lipid IV(A) lauroyltransferase